MCLSKLYLQLHYVLHKFLYHQKGIKVIWFFAVVTLLEDTKIDLLSIDIPGWCSGMVAMTVGILFV